MIRLFIPLILLLSLLGGIWFVTFQEESVQIHPYQGRNSEKLLKFDPEQIHNIRISHHGKLAILRRQDGIWNITAPTRDRVHSALPQLLLDFAQDLDNIQTIELDEISQAGQSLEDYGLGKDAIRLRYSDADDDATFKLDIGNISSWYHQEQATLYLRLPNSPASELIFVVPAKATGKLQAAGIQREVIEENLPQLLTQPYQLLRSTLCLPYTAIGAQSLEWSGQSTPLELQRKNSLWQLTSPISTWAENSQVQTILGHLTGHPASQIIEAGAIPFPEDHFELHVQAPDLNGQDTTFTLEIAFPEDNTQPIYVRPSHRNVILAYPAIDTRYATPLNMREIFQPSSNILRSRRLVNLYGYAVEEILIHGVDGTLLLEHQPQHWQLINLKNRPDTPHSASSSQPSAALPTPSIGPGPEPVTTVHRANHSYINNLLRILPNEPILEFITDTPPADLSPYGLENPALFLQFGLSKLDASDQAPNNPNPNPNNSHNPDQPSLAPALTTNTQAGTDNQAELDRRIHLIIGQGQDGQWYGQRSDEATVFRVRPQLINQINSSPSYWRSKRLVEYGTGSITEIHRQRNNEDNDILRFNPVTQQASYNINYSDATDQLNRNAAERLRATIKSLEIDGWLIKTTRNQRRALQQAPLILHITSGEINLGSQLDLNRPSVSQARYHTLRLAPFASATSVTWIGNIQGEESTFIINDNIVDILAADLLQDIQIDTGDYQPPPPPPPASR